MSSACSIPAVASIAGPPLVGFLLNWGLFGAISIQVYLYYLAFPKDRLFTKCLVFGIYALEAAQTFMLSDSAFKMFASGFGDVNALNNIGTIWVSIGILGAISACAVQSFYAYRIKVMTRKKKRAGVILLFSWISMAASIVTAALMNEAKSFTNLGTVRVWAATSIWQGSAVVCNVLIATSMTHSLKVAIKRGDIPKSLTWPEKAVRLIIETGILTATISIIALSLTYIPGNRRYYQAPIATLVKLYPAMLLVLLNSRIKIGPTEESQTWNDVIRTHPAPVPPPPNFGGVQCSVSSTRVRDSDMTAVNRQRQSELSMMPKEEDAGAESKIEANGGEETEKPGNSSEELSGNATPPVTDQA